MIDEPSTATDEGRKDGFVKGLGKAVARKAVVPLVAAASTAGTRYLTRKSSELWQDKVLPKVREKGGARALTSEVLEKASTKLGGRGSEALSALAGRLQAAGDAQSRTPRRTEASSQPERHEEPKQSDGGLEAERQGRRRRRQERQRALEQSGSS
jgi:hypothetical protein